jgi:hypothetical protein
VFRDKTTEAIAHFIGLFDLSTEVARLRKAFNEFEPHQPSKHEPGRLEAKPVSPAAPYDLLGFEPGIHWAASPEPLVKVVHDTQVTFRALPTREGGMPARPEGRDRSVEPFSSGQGGHGQLDPQGSVATFVHQEVRLNDNDFVSVGDAGVVLRGEIDQMPKLGAMVEAANRIAPLASLETGDATSSSASLIAFIDAAAEALRSYAEPTEAPDGYSQDVFVARGATLTGTFWNGSAIEEAPLIDDYLRIKPEEDEEAATPPEAIRMGGDQPALDIHAAGTTTPGKGGYADHAFVDVKTGSNTLVNTTFIENQWAAGHVLAAAGNYRQLDAISQINVWSDADGLDAALNGWKLAPGEATQAFNLAMFKQTDLSASHAANLPAPGQLPAQWAITTLKGDLTILSWIEQMSFVGDSDVAILTATGVKTTVGTGENMALNDAFITELGRFYDLVLVGGNIYDANIISQANILLDDDWVEVLPGFQTQGQAQLSAGNNLLWNEATIHNLHGSGVIQDLPGAYRDTLDDLAAGREQLHKGIFTDPLFTGMAGLRVLYVQGDFLNLQYIKQTNVLGDSDQVALAMSRVMPDITADWTVSTGTNQLINIAGIGDVDYSGKIYVGGQAYSDATLVQAELVANGASFHGFNPTSLVNEAVAFLQDDAFDAAAAPWKTAPVAPAHHGFDGGNIDSLHGMLA